MRKEKTLVIIYGTNDYPNSFSALNYKKELLGKTILNGSLNILLINKLGTGSNDNVCYKNEIPYVSIINRSILKSLFSLWKIIIHKKKEYKNIYIIYSYSWLYILINFILIGWILKIPVLANIEESILNFSRKSIIKKINDYFYIFFTKLFTDGLIVISDYLYNSYKRNYRIKVPVLYDYSKIKLKKEKVEDDYFLFCASTAYLEIIDFIISSFNILNTNKTKLILILNGKQDDINALKTKHCHNSKLEIVSNLNYNVLIEYYQNAFALLIPLRNNVTDIARFPHKIGEYLAVGRPIITTNYGEIKVYFKDHQNAFICNNYDILEFAEKMRFVLENKEFADEVGLNGRKLGEKVFDFRNYTDEVINFLIKLKK